MFFGVPGGLSGSQWGTQDANGVWSGWANGAAQPQAAYDPGAGAAFGGAAGAYTGGGADAYMAGLPGGGEMPTSYNAPSYNPNPSVASFAGGTAAAAPSAASFGGSAPGVNSGAPDMFAGGSSNFNPATGTSYGAAPISGVGGPGVGNTGGMPANPYLPQIAGDITRRTNDMMNAGIRQARGAAISAGGFGGSAQGIMEGKAIAGSADNLAGQLGNLYGSAWNQDQGRDLQRYTADQSFYGQQRGQDLQQAGIGAGLLGQGLQTQWAPLQGASGLYGAYSGYGNATTPSQGGGWQGLLGGSLGAAQLAQNMGWFAPAKL